VTAGLLQPAGDRFPPSDTENIPLCLYGCMPLILPPNPEANAAAVPSGLRCQKWATVGSVRLPGVMTANGRRGPA
jgi:hypothetical protein